MPEPKHEIALGRHFPGSVFTRLYFRKAEWDAAMKAGVDSEYYYVHSTLIHEWVHQLQTLATTFGREISFLLASSVGSGFPQLCGIV